MQNKKIFVLFVEPMLYGMDLIREVYEKSGFTMQYYYCQVGLTGKDHLGLPNGAVVGEGNRKQRKKTLYNLLDQFKPNFCVINGYTGVDQTLVIRYCIKRKIPYGIDSDTPLHLPSNKIKAFIKRRYLRSLLNRKFCYGMPGGTLQQENLEYYGIPKERNFIRPMSVSANRLMGVYNLLPSKEELKFKYNVAGKHTFVFVGRHEKVKSIDVLIDAFARLKQIEKQVALVIVGDGSLTDQLKAQVTALNLDDVHFEGYSVFPAVMDYFKVADVLVLPSDFEPWGLVVNEAMTCGLPVVVSSHVGCRNDLVVDSENGYIFEAGNAGALCVAMEKTLLCDLDYMSKKSLQKMSQWNFEGYLPKFIKMVEDVCERQ